MYFNRCYKIETEGAVIDSLKTANPLQVKFVVDTLPGANIAYAEISIANISREFSSKHFSPGSNIKFSCGYESNIGCVFDGVVNFVEIDTSQRPDIYTKIYCNSNSKRIDSAKSDQAFDKAQYIDIIKSVARKINANIVVHGSSPESLKMPLRGKRTKVSAKEELSELAKAFDFTWIDEGPVLNIYFGKSHTGAPVQTFSPETGLVGSLKVGFSGFQTEVLLTPTLKFRDRVKIEYASKTINTSNPFMNPNAPKPAEDGTYIIRSVRHVGSMYDGNFLTFLDMYPLGVE